MSRRLRLGSGALVLALLAACAPTGDPTPPPLTGARILGCMLGHCGLLHVVDFDGSFWVPVGHVGDDPATVDAVAGQMKLVGPDRAQFASGGRVLATLARFPGPKRFWLCA